MSSSSTPPHDEPTTAGDLSSNEETTTTGNNNATDEDGASGGISPNTNDNNNTNNQNSHNNNTKLRSQSSADSANADIYINPADGLPSQHPTLPDGEVDADAGGDTGEVDPDSFDDLPTSIIVTNIHSEVFTTPELKHDMEELFRTFSESATFQWLRSFRRLRVNYDNAIAAANARIKLHQYEFNKKTVITCYFAQPVTPVSHKNLQPPAPVKQFLISPPASPPAGWEPREENEPLVNHDLLAALASLTPGESHELHPQSEDQPAIIVHTAVVPDPNGATSAAAAAVPGAAGGAPKQPIVQTKCPERA